MSVETFDLSETITITSAAAAHFRDQLSRTGNNAVRIGLKPSGCSGFKYAVEEIDTPQDGDIHITLNNGVRIYFRPSDAAALRGSQIDFSKEGVNWTLKIENPNVTGECGCGESFNINLEQE